MNRNYSSDMWDLLFGVRRSIRYHDRRERFFGLLHRLVAFSWILLGSYLAYAYNGIDESQNTTCLVLTLALVAVSAADLVWGFAAKMALHQQLCHEFTNLETAIVTDSGDSRYSEYKSRRTAIESREPPKLHALDILCHNEVVAACYDGEDRIAHKANVKFIHRVTSQVKAWPDIASSIN